MKTVLFIALILNGCAAAISAQTAGAQQPAVNIRFAPTIGDCLRIIWTDKEIDEQRATVAGAGADALDRLKAAGAPRRQNITDKEIGYDWKIINRDAAGNTEILIRYIYLRIELTQDRFVSISLKQFGSEEVLQPGTKLVFDTGADVMTSNPMLEAINKQPREQHPEGFAQLVDTLQWATGILKRTLLAHPFTMIVSPAGKVIAVKGLERMMDQYREEMSQRKKTAMERAQLDALLEAFFSEESVIQTMTMSMLLPYPSQAVHPGEVWSDKQEFEILGVAVVVTRKLSLAAEPRADGQIPLSGTIETTFPKRHGQLSIDARASSIRLKASLDALTGMYRNLEYAGNTDITIRNEAAPADAEREHSINSRTSSSVVVKRLGSRDPRDRTMWTFAGGLGSYHVTLGPDWAAAQVNERIAGMLFTVFADVVNDAQLTTTLRYATGFGTEPPLDQAPARMKKLLESDGDQVKLSWSKLFETGAVHWVRFRLEITKSNGNRRVYWSQLGSGPLGSYSFELSLPNQSSVEFDAEVDRIYESIQVKEK